MGTRIPVIIRAPFKSASVGKCSKSIVEAVDLYKTLSELAGIRAPEASVQGKSLVPLFENPSANLGDEVGVAYSQYDRCPKDLSSENNITRFHGACKHTKREQLPYMGYTLRNSAWCYTAWVRYDGVKQKGNWSACNAHRLNESPDDFCLRELYSRPVDEDSSHFDDFEKENRAADPDLKDVVLKLHTQLQAHFNGDQSIFI